MVQYGYLLAVVDTLQVFLYQALNLCYVVFLKIQCMRDRVKKEFIIGHPALMLATFAFMRKWPTVIHFLLTLAGVIGIASMVETFCHLRTPVFMSIMRGYDGLLIGALFGVLLIIAVRFMMYVTQWFQAREVDHE